MNWFQTAFEIIGYPVLWLECISVSTGIIAVYLAAKEKIITWPLGLINIITAFFIYYHVQLYSDMFLQCYFFSISIYGWYYWSREKEKQIPLKWLTTNQRVLLILGMLLSSAILGKIVSQLHLIWPGVFPLPAAYPYMDTLVAIMSIVANTLLAKRIIENWLLWTLVNVLCVYLYIQKEIVFISFEFFVFLGISIFGLFEWMHLKKNQERKLQLN